VYVLRPRCLKGIVAGWLRSREFNPDSAISLLVRYDLGTLRSVKPLSGESRSQNVLVSTDRGRWMLKAYRASLGVEAIIFEHSLLQHLAVCALPAPRLESARSGDTCVEHAGSRYALYRFVDGYRLDRLLLSPSRRQAFLVATARILGRYHVVVREFLPKGRKLDGYRPDNGTRWRDHHWFARRIAAYREYLRSRQSQDSLLLDGLEVVERDLLELGERLARQGGDAPWLAIHGDVGPYNLLVRLDGSVMMLDFECAHLEMRAYDVISALATCAGRRDGSIDLVKANLFVQAYQELWPLEREEIRLMPDLFRYVKLCGLVWRLREDMTLERPLEANWLRSRLACPDWMARYGEELATALLQGAA
jgi:Ser/Thr protein kinase RdoA (MazF antagonist)